MTTTRRFPFFEPLYRDHSNRHEGKWKMDASRLRKRIREVIIKFQIGDLVVHPVHGVGTVTTFSKQSFTGARAQDYYEVTNPRITVWVPIDEQGSSVLREVASKNSLKDCRRLLKSRPVPLSKNPKTRKRELDGRSDVRLLPGLCELVRDLWAESRQKALGRVESDLFRKKFKALCDEWAASEGVPLQTALNEIESLLQVAQRQLPK
jgi:CarD family transcriptional regulator, regulator of rRNA transcription